MATSLIDVNDLFMTLVKDYTLDALYESSVTDFNVYLEGWLLRAIDEFDNICTQDLDYSESTQMFTETLTMKNKLMLSQLMVKYWMMKTIQDYRQMSVNITDHDFKHYSEAQNLKEKQAMYQAKREEIAQMMIEYDYSNTNWDNWDNQLFRS